MNHAIILTKLSDENGGGWLGRVPDLAGCMSDGDTPEEALSNTFLAVEEWLHEAKRTGREVSSSSRLLLA